MTFRTQSTPITTTSAGPSNTQASSSPEDYDIELSREEIFENNLNQLFTTIVYKPIVPRSSNQQGRGADGNSRLRHTGRRGPM